MATIDQSFWCPTYGSGRYLQFKWCLGWSAVNWLKVLLVNNVYWAFGIHAIIYENLILYSTDGPKMSNQKMCIGKLGFNQFFLLLFYLQKYFIEIVPLPDFQRHFFFWKKKLNICWYFWNYLFQNCGIFCTSCLFSNLQKLLKLCM